MRPHPVPYTGIGAYSKNFVDVFSGTANQAALAGLKQGGFGVYGERGYLLNEFNRFSAIGAMPVYSGTFALQADYSGFNGFNESQLGLAYARSLSRQINVGVKFNYHTITIAGYGSTSAINFEAGTIIHLTEKLHAGLHVYNPLSVKLAKAANERLASVYKAGFGYEVSPAVFISTEIVKEEDQPLAVNTGLQYNLHEKAFLRAGITTVSNMGYAGVGLQLAFARVDINASYHPQLGFTPGLLLLFQLKKAAKE